MFKLRNYKALDILADYLRTGYTDKTIIAFDIETNGLLPTVSKFHCAVCINLVTGEVTRYRPFQYDLLLRDLHAADVVIAHNGINYDVPALRKLYPHWTLDETKMIDTLVMARLIFSNIKDRDIPAVKRYRAMEQGREVTGWVLPPKLLGSQGLKAWGYRLGEFKGDYGEQEDAWEVFNEPMLEYCEQDVVVTIKLIRRLMKSWNDTTYEAMRLEHEIQWLMSQQERNGFKLDVDKAEQLYFKLLGDRERIRQQLVERFGSWWAANGITYPKRSMNRMGFSYTKDAPYTKLKEVTFNPASRAHCAKVLQEAGVVFTIFTDSGQPKIDDDTLEHVNIPEAQALKEFFMLNKRIGQIAEGKQAWLRVVTQEGFIHGSINPNGAVTGRATHSFPNIAQVPAKGKPYGTDCRQCFTVPKGWVLMGSDASGLELRCLGAKMSPWDKGAYIKVILEGDIHWENAQAAGFIAKGTIRDEHNDEHDDARNKAKTFIYAFLYGGGDELIGQLIGYSEEDYQRWKAEGAHVPVINQLKRRGIRWTREMVCHILKGKEVKKTFLNGLPALGKLIKACKKRAKDDGFVDGLDGRKIYTRSQHSSLNSQLQSDGGAVCKLWCVVVDHMMKAKGYKHGFDGDYAYSAWVHDEIQVACRTPEIAHTLGQTCKDAMKFVESFYKFECPLDAEYNVGSSWLETH
ncbi:DNA polymerase [Vibrio sp. SCSIO 43137]|uniref:DNA polymerase n=1 Tax=Vibrio sp. SCSIO 43137 TaxID=3021011 RepID=UPI002308052E|nr:DNA polymerase [Vibrio sp. SCSIO 43137]WCE28438.1 DNA polymerase [Vibrio sp. SCSIO 43137]